MSRTKSIRINSELYDGLRGMCDKDRYGDFSYHLNNAVRAYIKPKELAEPKMLPIVVKEQVDLEELIETKKKVKRFYPPTLEEVTLYCRGRNHVEPTSFIDYYNSNGWKVGKNKMKCWKSAIGTWEKRDKQGYTTALQQRQALAEHTTDYDKATTF